MKKEFVILLLVISLSIITLTVAQIDEVQWETDLLDALSSSDSQKMNNQIENSNDFMKSRLFTELSFLYQDERRTLWNNLNSKNKDLITKSFLNQENPNDHALNLWDSLGPGKEIDNAKSKQLRLDLLNNHLPVEQRNNFQSAYQSRVNGYDIKVNLPKDTKFVSLEEFPEYSDSKNGVPRFNVKDTEGKPHTIPVKAPFKNTKKISLSTVKEKRGIRYGLNDKNTKRVITFDNTYPIKDENDNTVLENFKGGHKPQLDVTDIDGRLLLYAYKDHIDLVTSEQTRDATIILNRDKYKTLSETNKLKLTVLNEDIKKPVTSVIGNVELENSNKIKYAFEGILDRSGTYQNPDKPIIRAYTDKNDNFILSGSVPNRNEILTFENANEIVVGKDFIGNRNDKKLDYINDGKKELASRTDSYEHKNNKETRVDASTSNDLVSEKAKKIWERFEERRRKRESNQESSPREEPTTYNSPNPSTSSTPSTSFSARTTNPISRRTKETRKTKIPKSFNTPQEISQLVAPVNKQLISPILDYRGLDQHKENGNVIKNSFTTPAKTVGGLEIYNADKLSDPNVKVYVKIGTDWCPPCQVMDRNIQNNHKNGEGVYVIINTENKYRQSNSELITLAKKYGFNSKRGYPQTFIFQRGKLFDNFEGGGTLIK